MKMKMAHPEGSRIAVTGNTARCLMVFLLLMVRYGHCVLPVASLKKKKENEFPPLFLCCFYIPARTEFITLEEENGSLSRVTNVFPDG